jgi:predicted DNA repair protein MutK
VDFKRVEQDKIKGAVRTDFVLSAEIIVITLGTVAAAPFATRVSVLVAIAIIMTVGVYGLVAGIVKLDDAGLYLSRRDGEQPWPRLQRRLGESILKAAPWMMKALSVAGTAAMFLVGGGILVHGIGPVHHWIEAMTKGAESLPAMGSLLGVLTELALNGIVGILAGALVLLAVTATQRLLRQRRVVRT